MILLRYSIFLHFIITYRNLSGFLLGRGEYALAIIFIHGFSFLVLGLAVSTMLLSELNFYVKEMDNCLLELLYFGL